MTGKTLWRVLCGLSLAVPTALLGTGAAHGSNSAALPTGTLKVPPLTATQAQALKVNPDQHVIVLLKNQHSDLMGRALKAQRAAAIAADQAPIVSELTSLNAGNVRQFRIINGISAVVSQAEVTRLKANPAVQAVLPDAVIKPAATPPPGNNIAPNPTVTQPLANACSSNPNAPLKDESLTLTNDLAARQLKTPQGAFIDGTGVKVAFIADNIDINNPEFFRDGNPANQSPSNKVISDYEDFNGDGPSAPGAAGEAFGDASAIAAQGVNSYNVAGYSSNPWPGGNCWVNVQGMAPGATLMALKVFGAYPAFSSVFVRAIDYAVQHNADVINESFGGTTLPNFPDNTVIAQADSAAVADGVAITASSGDAGTQGTIGSPATNQDVMAVGASTAERSEEQIGYPGAGPNPGEDPGRGTGWESNNISSFSSGGTSENNQRVVDFVAPGNSDWAACTYNPALYVDCSDFNGGPVPANPLSGTASTTSPNGPATVELFGGTSESAPITAGLAALVIQAYRSTHNSANPTPGEVKQIIKSTATNLDLPSVDQGSGLINALYAVQAALSLPDSQATPAPTGDSLLYATHPGTSDPASTLFGEDYPNTPQTFGLTVTNAGTHTEIVHPQVLYLPRVAPTNSNFFLSPTVCGPLTAQSPGNLSGGQCSTFHDVLGRPAHKINQTFTVNANQDYLNVAFAWDTTNRTGINLPGYPAGTNNTGSIVRMTLYDPSGRFVGYSRPQGAGSGFGSFEVHDPQPGKWTAVFWEVDNATTYSGPVQMSVTQEKFQPYGTVFPYNWPAGRTFPGALPLLPGHSLVFTIAVKMPANPGAVNVNVLLQTTVGAVLHQQTVVPLVLDSFINPQDTHTTNSTYTTPPNPAEVYSGGWTGILTGANGRPGGTPGLGYAFKVAANTHDISLGVTLPTTAQYNLEGSLVDPAGNPVDVQDTVTSQSATFQITGVTNTLQFFWRDPSPGIWRFVMVINGTIGTNPANPNALPQPQTQLPFTGLLKLNSTLITATGLPNNPAGGVAGGATVTATIHVTNTGNETESYFADIRQNSLSHYTEFPSGGGCPFGYVTTPLPALPFAFVTPVQGGCGTFINPPESTQTTAFTAEIGPDGATGGRPYDLELEGANGQAPFGFTGIPDKLGDPAYLPIVPGFNVYTNSATFSAGGDQTQTAQGRETTPGFYFFDTMEQGPFSDTQTADNSYLAALGEITTQTFDLTACSSTGDAWSLYTTAQSYEFLGVNPIDQNCAHTGYTPLVLAPVASGDITVQLSAVDPNTGMPYAPCTNVSGYVYIDTLVLTNAANNIIGTGSGDEVRVFPYTYQVANPGVGCP